MDRHTRWMTGVGGAVKATHSNSTWRRVGGRLAVLVLVAMVYAAAWPTKLSAAEEQVAIGPADTSSPRATLESFIDACNELHAIITSEHYFDRTSPEHYPTAVRILDCLDLSGVAEYERLDVAGEVATCLKEILDRVELPPLEEIPDGDAIEAAGGPEKLPRWPIPGTRIVIARVDEGPQQHEYLYSPDTVKRAKSYYRELESRPYRTTGPPVSEGLYRWYLPGGPLCQEPF